MSFTGEYHNLLDQKNRLSIPAKYRNQLNPVNDKTFVLCKGFDSCLFLYPIEEWKIVEEQLSSLSSIKDKHRTFIRKIARHANYVKYDSQGRIAIPDLLLDYAAENINQTNGVHFQVGAQAKLLVANLFINARYTLAKDVVPDSPGFPSLWLGVAVGL